MLTYTIGETAEMLRVSEKSIRNFINAGYLTGIEKNDHWRVTYDSLDELLEHYNDFDYIDNVRKSCAYGDYIFTVDLARLKGYREGFEIGRKEFEALFGDEYPEAKSLADYIIIAERMGCADEFAAALEKTFASWKQGLPTPK